MSNSQQMLLALEQQDLQVAQTFFDKALAEDTIETLLELALYLESIGFYPQAKAAYEACVETYSEALLSLARIANEDGLVEEAFAYLEKVSPDSPDYLEALVIKADIYQSEGLTDVAKEKLLEASQLTDEPLLVFGLAELEMELGEFREAISHYASLDNRAIYEQTGVSTYQRIGLAYASLGKFEAAIEFLEKAVELEYDDQTVYELATLLYDREEYQKANLYFKQLDAINPDFEGYEYAYAQSLHAEHQLAEALDMAKKGLAKNEFDSQLLLLASQYAYENHDAEQAEDYLLQAKQEADDLDDVILRLTTLYLEQERFQEVVDLESEEVDNLLARWNIAKAYIALEEDDRAQAIFTDIVTDLQDNPEFLADYIAFLQQLGDLAAAKIYAARYLQLVPDDVAMQEWLETIDL